MNAPARTPVRPGGAQKALAGAIRALLADPRSAEAKCGVDAAKSACSDEEYEAALAMVQQEQVPDAAPPATPAGALARGKLARIGRPAVMAALVALIAGGLGAYAAAASYDTVSHLAAAYKVALPRLNPIGIDGGLAGVILLDVAATWLAEPIWWLRLTARVFAAGTVAANAAAGWPDPVGVGLRVAAPVLFVVMTEAGRTLLLRGKHAAERKRKAAGREARRGDRIPRVRWLLDLRGTLAIWKRMRLWREPSYAKAVTMELERVAAIEKLSMEYGPEAWKDRAPADLVWMLTSGVRMPEALERVAGLIAGEERGRAAETELYRDRAAWRAEAAAARADAEAEVTALRADLEAVTGRLEAERETARAEAEEAARRIEVLGRKLTAAGRKRGGGNGTSGSGKPEAESTRKPEAAAAPPRPEGVPEAPPDLDAESAVLWYVDKGLSASAAGLAAGLSDSRGRQIVRKLTAPAPAGVDPVAGAGSGGSAPEAEGG
jgi:Protein of unknown function (DUF2637)